MRRRLSEPETVDPDLTRPVLPWRLVAGALLHVAVPAYLVVLATWWLAAAPVATPLSLVGRASGAFLVGFTALVLAASVLAALLDPALRRRRARRERADPDRPVRQAAARLAGALRRAEAIGGVRMTAAGARLRAVRLDLADERAQGLVADLSRAVDAFAAAHASAAPDRRPAIADQAAAAIDRVAVAAAELEAERARLDEGDALTHAAYLARRYPAATLDLAGPDPD